jgi:hypothetical protein
MTNVISALALATGLTVVLLTVTDAKVIPPYLKRSTQSSPSLTSRSVI